MDYVCVSQTQHQKWKVDEFRQRLQKQGMSVTAAIYKTKNQRHRLKNIGDFYFRISWNIHAEMFEVNSVIYSPIHQSFELLLKLKKFGFIIQKTKEKK
jgi:hypothetical protein